MRPAETTAVTSVLRYMRHQLPYPECRAEHWGSLRCAPLVMFTTERPHIHELHVMLFRAPGGVIDKTAGDVSIVRVRVACGRSIVVVGGATAAQCWEHSRAEWLPKGRNG